MKQSTAVKLIILFIAIILIGIWVISFTGTEKDVTAITEKSNEQFDFCYNLWETDVERRDECIANLEAAENGN